MERTKAVLRAELYRATNIFTGQGKRITQLPEESVNTPNSPFQPNLQTVGVLEGDLNGKKFADGRIVNRLRQEY